MSRLFEIKGELEMLLAQAIDVETGEIRDEAALKLFEAAEGQLEAQAVGVAVLVKELEAEAEKIREVANALAARAAVLAGAAEERKSWLREALPVGFKAKDARAAIVIGAPAKRVEISDEAMLPPEYLELKYAPRKDAIKADLSRGIEIDGAALVDGQKSVRIK